MSDDFGWQLLSLLRNFTGTLQSAVNFILFCLLGKHFRALLMKRFPLLRSVFEIFADCAEAARATRYRSRNRETSTEPAPARVGCTPVPMYKPRSSVELPSRQSAQCRDCRPPTTASSSTRHISRRCPVCTASGRWTALRRVARRRRRRAGCRRRTHEPQLYRR